MALMSMTPLTHCLKFPVASPTSYGFSPLAFLLNGDMMVIFSISVPSTEEGVDIVGVFCVRLKSFASVVGVYLSSGPVT